MPCAPAGEFRSRGSLGRPLTSRHRPSWGDGPRALTLSATVAQSVPVGVSSRFPTTYDCDECFESSSDEDIGSEMYIPNVLRHVGKDDAKREIARFTKLGSCEDFNKVPAGGCAKGVRCQARVNGEVKYLAA